MNFKFVWQKSHIFCLITVQLYNCTTVQLALNWSLKVGASSTSNEPEYWAAVSKYIYRVECQNLISIHSTSTINVFNCVFYVKKLPYCKIHRGLKSTLMNWAHAITRTTDPGPSSKSKFNLESDRVNLVAPSSPIEYLLYLPNVRAIQYKFVQEKLTRLGNSNVLRLLV